MTIVEPTRAVTGGIDTHGEVHVAAALDEVGGLLGTRSFRADPEGYSDLLVWLEAFGEVSKVGVEGTGSYGAGITRHLARAGVSFPRHSGQLLLVSDHARVSGFVVGRTEHLAVAVPATRVVPGLDPLEDGAGELVGSPSGARRAARAGGCRRSSRPRSCQSSPTLPMEPAGPHRAGAARRPTTCRSTRDHCGRPCGQPGGRRRQMAIWRASTTSSERM